MSTNTVDEALDLYDLSAFCRRHCIDRGTLLTLWMEGRGPRTARIGGKLYISKEAAREWRQAMERAAAQGFSGEAP